MSDKMKVRDGKDGYSYPYTSPDLVIDKDGKSNTTKFEELDSQFKDIATKIKGFSINLFDVGCSTNANNATNNTIIINNCIQAGMDIIVTDLFPIDDSLVINRSFSKCKIQGIAKKKTGFYMISDKPIILANETNTGYVEMSNISLIYKNQQTSGSSAILFTNTVDSSEDNVGYYRWIISGVYIEKCYNALYLEKTRINVWGTLFKDIHISRCHNIAIKLDGVSQLQNIFEDIKIINSIETGGRYTNLGSSCIVLTGEYSIKGLSIEGWNHTSGDGLIMLENGLTGSNCKIDTIHIESTRFSKITPVFFTCRGIIQIENLRIYDTTYGDYITKVLLCKLYQSEASVDGGTFVKINGFVSEKSTMATTFTKYLGGIGDDYQFNFVVENFSNKSYGNKNDIWYNFENVANHYTKNIVVNNKVIKSNSIPSGGTWEFDDVVIRNELNEDNKERAYYCTKSGTFGTISGITVESASSNVLLTNKFTYGALKIGQYILFNSTIYKIIEVDTSDSINNKVKLNKNIEGTISSLDITFSPPTFVGLTI